MRDFTHGDWWWLLTELHIKVENLDHDQFQLSYTLYLSSFVTICTSTTFVKFLCTVKQLLDTYPTEYPHKVPANEKDLPIYLLLIDHRIYN